MMRILHDILTGIAATIVIIVGGYSLYILYDYQSGAEDWLTPEITFEESVKVPLHGKGELRAFEAAYGEELLDFGEDSDSVLIPIYFQKRGHSENIELSGDKQSELLTFIGGCEESAPIVNAIYANVKTGAVQTIYKGRAFLAAIGAARFNVGDVVILLVVDQDTNDDNFLTCDDRAQLVIYSGKTNELRKLDIFFDPREVSFRTSGKNEFMAALSSESTDSAGLLNVYRIDVVNGEVMQLDLPDLLSEAKQAFERNDSE